MPQSDCGLRFPAISDARYDTSKRAVCNTAKPAYRRRRLSPISIDIFGAVFYVQCGR